MRARQRLRFTLAGAAVLAACAPRPNGVAAVEPASAEVEPIPAAADPAVSRPLGRITTGAGGPPCPEADEPEPATPLATKRWQVAIFFNEARKGIREHWEPGALSGVPPSPGEYTTRLELRVAADGTLERAQVDSGSGSHELDHEALRAVHQAAPFCRPPPLLLDDTGYVVFSFNFVLRMMPSGGAPRTSVELDRSP